MSDEEREVYEIIANMPIDTSRLEVLNDITFEAQLIMRSKFVRKIILSYEDFLNLHELGKDKEILLTTTLDGKRFLIYIDHGKIVSTAMADPRTGSRIVGLKPLATLILASKIKPISFKLFEVQKAEEIDKTRETPTPRRITLIERKPTTKPVKKKEEKPAILKFSEKLKEFMEKVEKEINEVAPFYGCKPVDLKIELRKGVINIKLKVTKKGLFSKCKVDKLKEVLTGDVDLYLSMLDLNIPFSLEIVEV